MMTSIDIADRTVGEIAVEWPLAIRIFEAWKIDYCCGGATPLAAACVAAGKTIEAFAAALESTADVPAARGPEWTALDLATIAANIVATYHQYTREELQTVQLMAEKVLAVHGERRPEIADVVAVLGTLRDDMLPHMLKEEQVLFPFVTQLEEAANTHRPAPTPFFGTVRNPVRNMIAEHDRVGELLAVLRHMTDDYTPPESACFSYRELYRRLAELELRTHEHIHIENNIYFPRAVSLEIQAGQPTPFEDSCGSARSH